MGEAIRRRGPDGSGQWEDDEAGICLVHRRLSIIDRSDAGAQPMGKARGRYQIIFNGEIYNHVELRQSLIAEGHGFSWTGHSDTETLLAAVETWGLERTLERCVGMFAIALWDSETRHLTLIRDRLGEKPLYYGVHKGVLLFSSDLKALHMHPAFTPSLQSGALSSFLRRSYVPAPHSIYQDIYKVMPGSMVTFGYCNGTFQENHSTYWEAKALALSTMDRRKDYNNDPTGYLDGLEDALTESIAGQHMADVPVGAFLSGGVDSSVIVALMQKVSTTSVRSFSIGFEDPIFNEAPHARAVAKHLGTTHEELIVQPSDALAVIPDLPQIFSEPFADSSQVPMFLVSRMAREDVTVALSGDGGDELFAGYNRYLDAFGLWSRLARLPAPLRKLAYKIIRARGPSDWNHTVSMLSKVLPRLSKVANPGEKMHKLASLLDKGTPVDFFQGVTSTCPTPEAFIFDDTQLPVVLDTTEEWPDLECFEHVMMLIDSLSYLPDDILVKVDRASMANSLEVRAPFLDHRVVERAWEAPFTAKIGAGEGKWHLRQILYKYVPREMIERPKMGFGIPIGDWLRGPLRPWAEDLLSRKRLDQGGHFRPDAVQALWQEHLCGKSSRHYDLWNILMFQAWLAEYHPSGLAITS